MKISKYIFNSIEERKEMNYMSPGVMDAIVKPE